MRNSLVISIISIFTLISCKNESKHSIKETQPTQQEDIFEFQNKGHEFVYNMTQKVGDYSKLIDKKDVVYTYTYQTPDGKSDSSTEKYIFNEELSYGLYNKHERTLPNLEGEIEQGYDGSEFWLKNKGEIVTDTTALKQVAFNRPTNFYWFTMNQKLLDPGLNYEYIKTQTIGDNDYDVVKVTFESKDNKPKDIYQVYINKETQLIDQFLFTVMEFGKSDPLLMELKYEDIDGILMPTERRYKGSNWDAEVTDAPWVQVTWTDIKFDNDLKKSDFKK
ncbi:hypothetical protein [Formosa sp. PL04]|uniref:hypothetical protein n=1 Tax=Formosa sp. PL04 TaxID=3081755 RepID=UPI0029825AF9|nr:hypothetical protein [Formosa sp. PL04]MDW5290800.1 hypothetical protein [Formosa sp. PL04]